MEQSIRPIEMRDFTSRYLYTRVSNSTPHKRGAKIKSHPAGKSLNFQAKRNKVKKLSKKSFQSFYLTLDEVMLKRFLLRSMMNGVGVNKTDCPKENKMTFSVPARSKTSHVFP
jgi:hypothetical protein